GTHDGNVLLWDVSSGKQMGAWQIDRHAVQILAFSPDGLTLASSASAGVTFLSDLPDFTKLRKVWNGYARALAFSSDGKMLAVCGGWPRNPLLVLDVATGKQRWGREGAMGMAFSPDGKTLAISEAGTVRLWDWATGSSAHSFEGYPGMV